jgi:hypothetical protein
MMHLMKRVLAHAHQAGFGNIHTVFAKIMPFNKEHDNPIKLFMPIHNTQDIPGIPLGKNLENNKTHEHPE